ncbi:hypothetical protein AB0L99_36985 [Streptomyces sp. NPDC051954]
MSSRRLRTPALSKTAFLVALPGLTLRGRPDGESSADAVEEVEQVG